MSGREVRIWAFHSFGQSRFGEDKSVFLVFYLIGGSKASQSFVPCIKKSYFCSHSWSGIEWKGLLEEYECIIINNFHTT